MIDDQAILDHWGDEGLAPAWTHASAPIGWLNARERHWLYDVGLPALPNGGWFETNHQYIRPESVGGNQFLVLGRLEPDMAKYALDSTTHQVVAYPTDLSEIHYANRDIDTFVHFLYAFSRQYEFARLQGSGPALVAKAHALEDELRALDPRALIDGAWWFAIVEDITSSAMDG